MLPLISQKEFFDKKLDDMIQTLYEDGTFIVSIRYYGYKINLYLLSNFYVEVLYNHKLDKVERIELLKRNSKRVKFYADQVNLPSNLLD
jgi:hypothetical protein